MMAAIPQRHRRWTTSPLLVVTALFLLFDERVNAFSPPASSTAARSTGALLRLVHHRPKVFFDDRISPRLSSPLTTAPPRWLTPPPPTAAVASSSKSSSTLRMVSYEDLAERLPSKSVIEAVESAKGGAIVASDVAASAGVSLSQARKDLTALASLSRGDIAVSSDGELIYTFPTNLGGVLSSNSAKYKARAVFEKVWPGVFYAVRVSFGVVLLASLFAIFSTIFFLSQGASSSDDDRRRDDRGFGGGGGMRFGFNPFWGPSPFDFFYYRPYYGYYGGPGVVARDPNEMGFLESTFSYIFGDGNPNNGLEERQLSLVANMIRENGGAVTAEQLAPYCDEAPMPDLSGDEKVYVDESFVLPIVTKLNGEPTVTGDGDIVYLFPDLQQTAASSSSSMVPSLPSKEASILRRAGLEPDASTRTIKSLLSMNGISTRGALERRDVVALLESALPPPSPEEEAELAIQDPTLLTEREYEFSLATPFNRILAGGLGAVNLAGALYLGNMFATYAAYGVRLPSYFGTVQAFYPLLLLYAVLFNAIPVIRSFWIKGQNERIRQRNKVRRSWRTALGVAAGRVGRKVKAARKMGTRMKRLGSSDADIVFDTTRSMEENDATKERESMRDFDKLLDRKQPNDG